jgi:predicted amidohydrolase YtcJ
LTRAVRDAHLHLAQHGRAMAMVRLEGCADKHECLQRLAVAAQGPAGAWVLAGGMRAEGWREPVYPTAREVDEAVGGRPCAAWSFDHHALVASSAALRAAGIGAQTPDPPGGVIDRDRAGEPTGLVLESAALMVWRAVPEPTAAQRRGQVLAALADLRRHGFVEVHDLHAPAWLGPELAAIDDGGGLEIRVVLYPPLGEFPAVLEGYGAWRRDRVVLGGAKLFADGTLNSRTAWMLHPYREPMAGHEFGKAMYTPQQLEEAVRRVDGLGYPLAVHAIGDGAVRAVLDTLERARPRTGGFRIEHAELIDERDVPRFARLGVVCSPQPCHLLADIEALRRYVPDRLDRVLPLRELIDSGAAPGELLWFGSDCPIVRPDPQDSIRAAVDRCRATGDEPIAPGQAISELEAWAAFAPGSGP